MSFWVAGAVVVGTGVSAYSSDKASEEQAKSTKRGLNQSLDITNRARQDAIALFDASAKRSSMGLQQALDFYKTNALKRMQPFVQGNQSAQNVISQGAQQANNAILGLPVNMNFNNQPQPTVDYSGINAAVLPSGGLTMSEAIAGQESPTSTPVADAVADAVKARQGGLGALPGKKSSGGVVGKVLGGLGGLF